MASNTNLKSLTNSHTNVDPAEQTVAEKIELLSRKRSFQELSEEEEGASKKKKKPRQTRIMPPKKKLSELPPLNSEDLEDNAEAPAKTDEKLDLLIQLMRGTQRTQSQHEEKLLEVEQHVSANSESIKDLNKRVASIEEGNQDHAYLLKEQERAEKNIIVRHENALTAESFNALLEAKQISSRIRELIQIGKKDAKIKMHVVKLESATQRNQLLYEIGSKLGQGFFISKDIPKSYKNLH